MRALIPALALAAAGALVHAQPAPQLASDLQAKIDVVARDVLKDTGVPSASLAVVQDDKIAYVQAYGDARLEPKLPATPAMRYSIGSISKQFTAAAILLLQEARKLSLDDPIGKYVPGLTDGDRVTIRQILSHTSGYQDFWPQDYVPPLMLQPITAEGILDRWARRPLDFQPGTKWQYSNTNFVIAGLIVEKAAGMPLWTLLEQRIFTPLGMKSVTNTDEHELPATDPKGYFRYALGPARPAPKEGPGWMFAAGELAMTPEDLAKWDLSMIHQSVLQPASYRELERDVLLQDGVGTRYGLGIGVSSVNGHRQLEHSGEVSGFTAENIVLPDDGLAIAVLTNQDAASAASQIGRRVRTLLLERHGADDAKQEMLARRVFEGLREGRIDRTLFTGNANAYFTDQAVRDYEMSLRPLGAIESFTATSVQGRGGMIHRSFEVRFAPGGKAPAERKTVSVSIYEMPDGKYEQYLIAPRD